MKPLTRILIVVFTLSPLTVFANHTVSRVCMDPLDPTAVSVNLYFRTVSGDPNPTDPGTHAIVNVPVGNLSSDSVKCVAPQIGVVLGNLGLLENTNPGYFIKATALDAAGHESAISAEALNTPLPLDTTAPAAVTGVEGKP